MLVPQMGPSTTARDKPEAHPPNQQPGFATASKEALEQALILNVCSNVLLLQAQLT